MKRKKLLKEINKPENFELVLDTVLKLLKTRIKKHNIKCFNTQGDVRDYLILNFKAGINELFSCMFLDNKHRLIAYEEIFQGTINQTQVYPRVVVQRAIYHNASAVIFAHNHPSGELKPSQSDINITNKLQSILEILDIRVLDHFIVSSCDTYSMAQNGDI